MQYVPSDVGRTIRGFASMKSIKAREWLNWVTIFSEIVLAFCPSVPYNSDKIRGWRNFVRACRIFNLKYPSSTQLNFARQNIGAYLAHFLRTYGAYAMVPNHHCLVHLCEDVFRVGTAASFSEWGCVLFHISSGSLCMLSARQAIFENRNVAKSLAVTVTKIYVLFSIEGVQNGRVAYRMCSDLVSVDHFNS